MRILFIEDHPYKLGQVLSFLKEFYPDSHVDVRNSYNSGLKELVLYNSKYDLLLLDISMPNYDISSEESGGEFIPLAGKLILKEMYLREISTKAIVVTMHGNFEDGTKLAELDETLRKEFSDNYIGYVYFTVVNSEWKTQLASLIKKHQNDSNTNC